jgi:hypothetical protein
MLGQLTTVWDSHMLGYTGDTVGMQIPATVELPAPLFQKLNNCVIFRVGISQLTYVMYVDPDRQICEPFGNQDAETGLIQCPNSIPASSGKMS